MRLDRLKKELCGLVGKIESGGPDMERLHALERVFQLCNLCSTQSELRTFHDVIPEKRIPRLAKLAVARSGKGAVALSPSAERLMSELAVWAKAYDPAPDLAAVAIRRGDEKEIQPVVSAIVVELACETESVRAVLAVKLKQPGRGRIGALGDIVVRRRGSEIAQNYSRALLHTIRCVECSRDQAVDRCRCGCKRKLCARCAEIDGTTRMILSELARAS